MFLRGGATPSAPALTPTTGCYMAEAAPPYTIADRVQSSVAVGFLHAIESVMLPVLDVAAVQKCALGLDLDQGISMRGWIAGHAQKRVRRLFV